MEAEQWQHMLDHEKTLTVNGLAEIVGLGYSGPVEVRRSVNGGILSTTPALPPATSRRSRRRISKALDPLFKPDQLKIKIYLNKGMPNPK